MMKYKLEELCEFIKDGTHNTPDYCDKENGVIFLSSKDVTTRKIDWNNTKYIPKSLHEKLCARVSPKVNDILLAKNGTTGVAALVDKEEVFDVYVSLAVLRPKENVYPKYLLYAINSPVVKRQFNAGLKGVGVPNLHLNVIRKAEINIHDFSKQIEICVVLNTVDNLIELRGKELQLLDDLIKSRFVEMFGDCSNYVRLGDCCEVHARIGWQALTKDEHMKKGEYMLITGTDFKDGEINYDKCVYVTKKRYEMDKHIILKNDDILITKDGTIGKVAIVHNLCKPATLNAGIFVVRPDIRFNKEYISSVFRGPLFSDYVEAAKTGATIKHLNQKHLIEFMIPMPPLEKQEIFAKFLHKTDKSKFEIQKSIDELQTLYDSLMQEYFG